MDPEEEKKLLEENLKIARENNRLLRKIRSSMKWSTIIRIVYWVIIIGSMLGLLYFFQPFFDGLVSAIKEFTGTFDDAEGAIQAISETKGQ